MSIIIDYIITKAYINKNQDLHNAYYWINEVFIDAATDFVFANQIVLKFVFHLNSIPLSIPETLGFLTSGKIEELQ